jgi:hypothetical protein
MAGSLGLQARERRPDDLAVRSKGAQCLLEILQEPLGSDEIKAKLLQARYCAALPLDVALGLADVAIGLSEMREFGLGVSHPAVSIILGCAGSAEKGR